MVEEIIIFTDGSADNMKKTTGGIGVYFNDKKLNKYNISKTFEENNATNQRMELKACIYGIKKVIRLMDGKCKRWNLKIYTDSMYTIKCMVEYAPLWIQNGWKRMMDGKCKPVQNLDLIKQLYSLSSMYPVKYIHVNSHLKEPTKDSPDWFKWYGNMMADKLATDARKK